MSTLESAGFVYNPFTSNDIWGGPNALALPDLLKKELPVGADDSPLKQMIEPGLLHRAPIHPANSGVQPQVRTAYQQRREQDQSTQLTYLALFGAILLGAFYFRVPGSQ
jgi:hypothetical protein